MSISPINVADGRPGDGPFFGAPAQLSAAPPRAPPPAGALRNPTSARDDGLAGALRLLADQQRRASEREDEDR